MPNPSKFFSAALEAAQNLKQKHGTAQQMRSMLLQGGAKPKELEYIGADDFMKHWAGRKERLGPSVDDSMTQDQLVDYIDRHQVKPEEVLKHGASSEANDERLNEIADALFHGDRNRYRQLTGVEITEDWLDFPGFDDQGNALLSSSQEDARWDEAWNAAHRILGDQAEGDTKWSQYVTGEPSDKYTEHLVTLPEGYGGDDGTDLSKQYQSPHWDEPNVLAHMRYDYDPDALRLEEIQSDWLQQAREKGFKWAPEEEAAHAEKMRAAGLDVESLRKQYGGVNMDAQTWEDPGYKQYRAARAYHDSLEHERVTNKLHGLPRAPLANVNDWTSMMVRRAMLEAAENDLPKLRWTTGYMQDQRYSPQAGRAKYYDEIIPNIVNKIAKPYGEAKIMLGRPDMNHQGYWDSEFHNAELPPKLIEALQKKGKVPFFKYGGEVE